MVSLTNISGKHFTLSGDAVLYGVDIIPLISSSNVPLFLQKKSLRFFNLFYSMDIIAKPILSGS